MPIKKILWPTDFSKLAEKALPQVNSLTQKYQAEIHVMYVIENLHYYQTWLGGEAPHEVDRITHFSKAMAEQKMAELCGTHLKECSLPVQHIVSGDSAKEILKMVEQEHIDMVIMSTRGGEGHFPFGSVTERVVKNSPVPVVTIPV